MSQTLQAAAVDRLAVRWFEQHLTSPAVERA